MKARIKCSFEVVVDVPDTMSKQSFRFMIEENGCPGTGTIGRIVEDLIESHEVSGTCWACAVRGRNEIVEWLE